MLCLGITAFYFRLYHSKHRCPWKFCSSWLSYLSICYRTNKLLFHFQKFVLEQRWKWHYKWLIVMLTKSISSILNILEIFWEYSFNSLKCKDGWFKKKFFLSAFIIRLLLVLVYLYICDLHCNSALRVQVVLSHVWTHPKRFLMDI